MKKVSDWFKQFVSRRQEHLHLPQDLRLENPVVNTAPLSVVPLNYYNSVGSSAARRNRGGHDVAS